MLEGTDFRVRAGQKAVAGGHAGREFGIEVEVAVELAERIIRRFKSHDLSGRTDEVGQRQRVGADIGADIEHQRTRLHQPAQRCPGLPLVTIAEIDRESIPCERSRS